MNDKVKCLKCGRLFGSITTQHLKGCSGISLNDYKKEFPQAETISEKGKSYRIQNCKNIVGQTKIVQCSKCGNDMETSATNHWKFICEKCRTPETYIGKSYLENEDKVVCQICWQALDYISWTHVKLHGITVKEYREKFPDTPITHKKIIEDRRIRFTGGDNPATRPEVRKTMSEAQRYTSKHYIKKYPWIFPEVEPIRDTFGKIEVQCKKCKKWFNPSYSQLYERVRALTNGSDGEYYYCSNECKGVCPLYRLNPSQFLSAFNGERFYTDTEYNIFREEVLRRQKEEFGYNFCEMCESKKDLQVHHEKPQKTHPHMSLDPDNGIVLCDGCHMKKVHVGECSKANLANIC